MGGADYGALIRNQRRLSDSFEGVIRSLDKVHQTSKVELDKQAKKNALRKAAQTRLKRYPEKDASGIAHPKAGQLVAPAEPEAGMFGTLSVYDQYLQDNMLTKYFIQQKLDLQTRMKEFATAHNPLNDLPDAKGFKSEAQSYLTQLYKDVHPAVQADVMAYGNNLLTQYDNSLQDEWTRKTIDHNKMGHEKSLESATREYFNLLHTYGYDEDNEDIQKAKRDLKKEILLGKVHYGSDFVSETETEIMADAHVGSLFYKFKQIEATGKTKNNRGYSKAENQELFIQSIQDYTLDAGDEMLRLMDPKRRAGMIAVMRGLQITDARIDNAKIDLQKTNTMYAIAKADEELLNENDKQIVRRFEKSLRAAFGNEDDALSHLLVPAFYEMVQKVSARTNNYEAAKRARDTWKRTIHNRKQANETNKEYLQKMSRFYIKDVANSGVRNFGDWIALEMSRIENQKKGPFDDSKWTLLAKRVGKMQEWFEKVIQTDNEKELIEHQNGMRNELLSYMLPGTKKKYEESLIRRGEAIRLEDGNLLFEDTSIRASSRRTDILTELLRGEEQVYKQKTRARLAINQQIADALRQDSETNLKSELVQIMPKIRDTMPVDFVDNLEQEITHHLQAIEKGTDRTFRTYKGLMQYVKAQIAEAQRVEGYQTGEERVQMALDKLIKGYQTIGSSETAETVGQRFANATKDPKNTLLRINAEYANIASQVKIQEATNRRLHHLQARINANSTADPSKGRGSDVAALFENNGVDPFDLATAQKKGLLNAGIHIQHVEIMKGVQDWNNPEKISAAVKLWQHYTNQENIKKSQGHLRAQLGQRVSDILLEVAQITGDGTHIDDPVREKIKQLVEGKTGVVKAEHENLNLLPGVNAERIRENPHEAMDIAQKIFHEEFGAKRPNQLFWTLMDVYTGTNLAATDKTYPANFPIEFKQAVIKRALVRLNKYTGTTEPTLNPYDDGVKKINFQKSLHEAVNALTTKGATGEGTWGWSNLVGGQPGQYRATHYLVKNPPAIYFSLDLWANRRATNQRVPSDFDHATDIEVFEAGTPAEMLDFPGPVESITHETDWMLPFATQFVIDNAVFPKGTSKHSANFVEGFGLNKLKTLSLQYHSMNTDNNPPTPLYTVSILDRSLGATPVMDLPYMHDKRKTSGDTRLIIDFYPEMLKRNAEEDLRFEQYKAVEHMNRLRRRENIKESNKVTPLSSQSIEETKRNIAKTNKIYSEYDVHGDLVAPKGTARLKVPPRVTPLKPPKGYKARLKLPPRN